MKEYDIISKYLSKLSKNNPSARNLNDDVLFYKKKRLVISVDTYNENIHFLNFKSPNLAIKKILRSSISDLICKGVNPKYYFIALSAPKKIITKKILNLIVKSLHEEQKKYNIVISGGDTSLSKNLSFTVTSVGFSNSIVKRNTSIVGDDIYVTGNVGDSFIGLNILKKKIFKINKKLKNYFICKYFKPELAFNFTNILYKYANSSIDISDGLISDLLKLINKQNVNFEIYFNKIPVSGNFKKIMYLKNLKKINYVFNGDDYQVLFTAPKKYRNLILKNSKVMNQKVTIIGKIINKSSKNILIEGRNRLNIGNYRGYTHLF